MKFNLNIFIVALFVIYFSLSIISSFTSGGISEWINWIMIIGFLAFFLWMIPKSIKNKKDREG